MNSKNIFNSQLASLSRAGKTNQTKTQTIIPTLSKEEFPTITFQAIIHTSCVQVRFILTVGSRTFISKMQWKKLSIDMRRTYSYRRKRGISREIINRGPIKTISCIFKTNRKRSAETTRTPNYSLRFRWKSLRLGRTKRQKCLKSWCELTSALKKIISRQILLSSKPNFVRTSLTMI